MGFRSQKYIRLLPDIRINLSIPKARSMVSLFIPDVSFEKRFLTGNASIPDAKRLSCQEKVVDGAIRESDRILTQPKQSVQACARWCVSKKVEVWTSF
jgi:hypothetical protein